MIIRQLYGFIEQLILGFFIYWGRHFELIFYFQISFIITVFIAYILAVLTEWSLVKFFRLSLINLFILGVLGMMVLSLFGTFQVYRINYVKQEVRLAFPDSVVSNTEWIEDEYWMYYTLGRELRAVNITGLNDHLVFTADSLIKEYHISPNGEKFLIVSEKGLYSLDIHEDKQERIDQIALGEGIKGVISGVAWAPDSERFCYEISQWSKVATSNKLYVYDLNKKEKKHIFSPARKISSLRWDRQIENLYYLYPESKDTTYYAYSYLIKVFAIPLDKLKPQLVAEIPSNEPDVPLDSLDLRDIELFLEGDKLSFYKRKFKEMYISEDGSSIDIDDNDYLYYIPRRWFRFRLFEVPRGEPLKLGITGHEDPKGDFLLKNFKWIPGNRYVFMQHEKFGPIILDVRTMQIGFLNARKGADMFGWYDPGILSDSPIEE